MMSFLVMLISIFFYIGLKSTDKLKFNKKNINISIPFLKSKKENSKFRTLMGLNMIMSIFSSRERR